ncbi:MAG: FHA domain-containing protein [Chloroflexi bacterium]|nr:FHA domain-containing protein [Chloroflexota bacterium]
MKRPVQTAGISYKAIEMNLREIESRLQTLIEVDLLKVLPGRRVEDVIVQKLATAIQQNRIVEGGVTTIPDVYMLALNPETAKTWMDERLLTVILNSITTVAHEAGFKFTISPTVTVTTDDRIHITDVEITTSHRIETMAETNATPLDTGSLEAAGEKIPENSFLIVEGVKIYPLTLPVVNIGRRLDNQLVIDDPRVSRNHAQLRAIKGRFVVFDLNSTGGTFVNGQRTSQSVLYPGDVISLAGVALIFGQDNPPPRPDLKNTAPFKNQAPDRPTAVFSKEKDHSTADFKKKK